MYNTSMTTFVARDCFTLEQVQDFARISGDDQEIHVVHGVVQGGFIISKLPQWLVWSKFTEQEYFKDIKYALSAKMDLKFSRPVKVNIPVTIEFSCDNVKLAIVTIDWIVKSEGVKHCWGSWKVVTKN
jgi:hypothetical protein